jgi:NMD protein affecting ribosome stability and mRNA decay
MEKPNNYYEGVLQLRNPDKEVLDYIYKKILDSGCRIAKEKKMKNGIDLYLSSNKFLKKLAKDLQNNFAGQLIMSSKLYSKNRQTSKEVHRGCVCFRIPNFKKGDVIQHKGEDIQILNLDKKIYAKDLKTNKKLHIDYKELL